MPTPILEVALIFLAIVQAYGYANAYNWGAIGAVTAVQNQGLC